MLRATTTRPLRPLALVAHPLCCVASERLAHQGAEGRAGRRAQDARRNVLRLQAAGLLFLQELLRCHRQEGGPLRHGIQAGLGVPRAACHQGVPAGQRVGNLAPEWPFANHFSRRAQGSHPKLQRGCA